MSEVISQSDDRFAMILRAFIAKSPSARPSVLVREAVWGGVTWRRTMDGDEMKFVSQGPVQIFNDQYASQSMPQERIPQEVIKDTEIAPPPPLVEEE